MATSRTGPSAPGTKAARHAIIRELLAAHAVHSQNELGQLLTAKGFDVTQATLSRDLVELCAEKVRLADGTRIYAVPGDGPDRVPQPLQDREQLATRLQRLCGELLVTAEDSGNVVVLRTPPGAAHFLASAIDHSIFPQIMGTVAGDDTVVIITRRDDGGADVARRFLELASHGGLADAPSPAVTNP